MTREEYEKQLRDRTKGKNSSNRSSREEYEEELKRRNAANVQFALSKRAGALFDKHSSVYEDIYNRMVSGKELDRDETADWYERVNAGNNMYLSEYHNLMSKLGQYEGYLDPDWQKEFTNQLESGKSYYENAKANAQAEKDYFNTIDSRDDLNDQIKLKKAELRNMLASDVSADNTTMELMDLQSQYDKEREKIRDFRNKYSAPAEKKAFNRAEVESRISELDRKASEVMDTYSYDVYLAQAMAKPFIDEIKSLQNQVNLYDRTNAVIDKYAKVREQENFAEDSTYRPELADDKLGMYHNPDSEAAKQKVGLDPNDSTTVYDMVTGEAKSKYWDQLLPEEEEIYYALFKNEGQEAAYRFLDEMEVELGRRYQEEQLDTLNEEIGTDSLKAIMHNIASIPANVYGGIMGFTEDALRTITGNDINPYSSAHSFQNYAQNVRGTTSSLIDKATDTEDALFSWGDFYQALMSGADSILGGSTLGTKYTYLMGMSAASSEARKLYEQGASNEQIFMGALLSGTAESFFEEFSLDHFVKMLDNPATGVDVIRNFLRQGGVEASEEIATEIANTITNYFVMGGASEYEQNVQKFMEEGYSEDEAKRLARHEVYKNVAKAGLGGFVSGGAMAGGASAINAVQYGGNYYLNQGIDALQNDGYNILLDQADEIINKGGTNALEIKRLANIVRDTAGNITSARDVRQVGKLSNAVFQSQAMDTPMGIDDIMGRVKESLGSKWEKEAKAKRNASMRITESYGIGQGKIDELVDNTIAEILKNDAERKYSKENGDEIVKATGSKGKYLLLETADGKTISSKDAIYKDSKQAALYETAAKQGWDAEITNNVAEMIGNIDDPTTMLLGIAEEIRYGKIGAQGEGVFSKVLSPKQKQYAYSLGRQLAERQASVTQSRLDVKAAFGENATNLGKVSFTNSVNLKRLSGRQKVSLSAIGRIANITNTEYIFYASRNQIAQETIPGIITIGDLAPNGAYANGKIYIDINAGNLGEGTILFTAAHELTHHIKSSSPAKFKILADFLMSEFGKQGTDIDSLIQNQIRKSGGKLSYDDAFEEVVADSMQRLFVDTNMVERLEKLKNTDRTLWEKIRDFIQDLYQRIKRVYKGLDPSSQEAQEVKKMGDKIEKLADLFAEALVDAGDTYARITAMSDSEAFKDSEAAVMNQIRTPYTEGTNAWKEFVDGLNPEAKKVHDLFYNFYTLSKLTNVKNRNGNTVKKLNISSVFMTAQDWNDQITKDQKWGDCAKKLAESLPEKIRKKMNMNLDGSLTPTSLETEFKMAKSLAQRLVDALGYETIENVYDLDGHKVTLATAGAVQSVGGEAYRRAVIAETRKLYKNGELRQVNMDRMSKDLWGSLGFLAVNTKTGASGDFTTICPQMMFNRGCFYCYRRAALTTGVNNKLVAESVWYTGEILRIKDSDIQKLNEMGGLRIQSFGDWMPHFSAQLADVLYDAELRGLQVKIITKEPSMIEYIAGLRKQGIGQNLYFNLSADYAIEKGPEKFNANTDNKSLDTINSDRPYMRDEDGTLWWKRAMTVEEANEYHKKYSWVNVRIVATTQEEFIRGLKDPRVQVVTGYHGNIREWERIDSTTGEKKLLVEPLGDAGMPRFIEKDGEWSIDPEYPGKKKQQKELAQKILDEGLAEEYYKKVCCVFGRCADCKGKCGKYADTFYAKNATNDDAESIAYWAEHMTSAQIRANKKAGREVWALLDYTEDSNPMLDWYHETYGDPKATGETKYSARDSKYLELAKDPEKNEAKLREMVKQAAEEAGYTEELFHGTESNFNSFDIDKAAHGTSGYGFYFGDKELADEYGKNGRVLNVFVNSNNIGSIKTNRITVDAFEDAVERLGLSPETTFLYTNDSAEDYVKHHNDYIIATDLQYWNDKPQRYAIDEDASSKSGRETIDILKETLGLDGIRRGRELILWDNTLIKSADPVTYDDDGNVIPLSERFNEQSDDIRYSTRESAPNDERTKEAKKVFGTTTDFREAGYLLRDGSMLDFSGKRDGGPAHVRYMDHREIAEVFDEDFDTQTEYLDAFLNEGNIRLMETSPGMSLGELEPTPAQYSMIKKYIEHCQQYGGYFMFDIADVNGRTIASRDYSDKDSASKIISDIREFYKNGELPYRSELNEFRYQARAVKQATSLTEEEFRDILQDVQYGLFNDGTYIPMRSNTPQFLIDVIREYTKGKDVFLQLPMISKVEHVRQVMEEVDDASYGNKRPHNLDSDDLVAITRKMSDPDYILKQKNGRYSEVVSFYNKRKKNVTVVIDFADEGSGEGYKYSDYMNGYGGGYYNVIVTEYEPDNLQKYLDGCEIVYDKKIMNGRYQVGSGRVVTVTHDTPFVNNLPQTSGKVKQDISSADTSLNQIPSLFTDSRVEFGKTNIDVGGGRFDKATQYLAERGTKNYIFDPFNRTAPENRRALNVAMNGGADTATCANVLNVIAEKEARANVILETAKSIKPDGTAYFMVYEGDGSGIGRETSKGYQNNRKTADYVNEIEEYFDDVERHGKLIIATNPKSNLPQAAWQLDNSDTPEVVMYSTRDAQKHAEAAKNYFGTTDDIYHASFLLADGKLLNNVNKDDRLGWFGSKADFEEYVEEAGREVAEHINHEEIYWMPGINEDYEKITDDSWEGIDLFINEGNIRLIFNNPTPGKDGFVSSSGVQISGDIEPTKEQYATLYKGISKALSKQNFFVGIGDEKRLDYPANTSPDKVIADIKYYFANGEIRDNSLQQFRYSNRDPEVMRQLKKVNAHLEKENAQLKEDFKDVKELLDLQGKVTGGRLLKRSSVEALARRFIKGFDVKGDYKELADILMDAYGYIQGEDNPSWENVEAKLGRAVDWISSHKNESVELSKDAKSILKMIRESKVSLSDKMKSNAAHQYGSYGNYRKAMMGSITISDNAPQTLDQLWQELSSMHPEYFDPEVSEGDMPVLLADAISNIRNSGSDEFYYGQSMMTDREIFDELYNGFWDAATLYTVADKKQSEINALKRKHQERMASLRSEKNERIAELKKESSEIRKGLKKEYRERLLDEQKKLQEQYRERVEKARDKRSATELRHRITKKVNELNKLLLHPDSKHHVPKDMQASVAAALDLLDFENPRQGEKTRERLAYLKKMYDGFKKTKNPDLQYAYDELIAEMIDNVAEDIGDTPFQKMSVTQLEEVYQMYSAVLATIRNANKTFKWMKQQDIIELSEDVMKEVKEVGGSKEMSAKKLESIKKFAWNDAKPVYAMRMIGSDTLMKLFNNVRKGEDTFAKDISEAKAYFIENAEKYGYRDWDLDERYEFKTPDGKTFTLNLMEMMSLYEYNKRPQADAHLSQGGFVFEDNTIKKKNKLGIKTEYKLNTADTHRVTPMTMAEISKKLTPEQKTFADAMQKYLADNMGAKGNEVTEALYDIDIYNDEHYFPLKSSKLYMQQKTEAAGDVKVKNAGFTKAVVPFANNPIVLRGLMDVWADHVNDMSMYHAFVLPLEDFQRVYNYRTSSSGDGPVEGVKAFIRNAYGDAANNYIQQMLVDLNGGARADSRAGTLNQMIGLFKKGAVFASASVVIQQPSAIARAFAYIDPKYFVQSSLDTWNLKEHSAQWEEVKKYAPVAIIKEMGFFDTGLGASTQDWITQTTPEGFSEKAKSFFTDANYRDDVLAKAPELADEIAWTHIWNAAKKQVLAENPGLEEGSEEHLEKAGELFTETIVNTQVYDSVLSRSALMRAKDSGTKMVTSFLAEPTTSLNMLADAIVQGKRTGNTKQSARVIGSVIAQILLNSILVSLVYAARDDDEDKTYVEKYVGQLVSNTLESANPLNMIPLVKDIVSLTKGYDVERPDMAVFAEVIKAWQKLKSSSVSPYRKVEDFAGSVAKLFGLPVKNIMRDVRGIMNIVNGMMSDNTTSLEGIRESIVQEVTGKKPSTQYKNKLTKAIKQGDTAKIKSAVDNWVKQKVKTGKTEKEAKSAIQSTLTSTYKPLFLQAYQKGDQAEMARIRKALAATGIYKDVVKTTQDWIKSLKDN